MKKYVIFGGILLSLVFALPTFATEEAPTDTTSTPPTDEVVQTTTPTTTPDITPTTTPDITPTSTLETTPTTTPEISPTTTLEISTTTPDSTPTTTPETISTSTPSINSGSTSESNNTPPPVIFTSSQINETVRRINNYLRSQQSPDGKIQDGTATDWAIMSFGAVGQYANEIKNGDKSLLNYEENYELNDPKTINICAGYPRHILAFLAAGIDTNHSAITNLRNNILSQCYQNNTYGEFGINDDVFALFALLSTGSTINDQIIIDIINAIKADQTNDGAFTFAGWAGADMTGAAINALKYAEYKGANIDPQILARAKQYLKNNQLADGGWGYGSSDVLTTSWAMMGINALHENQNDRINSGQKNPWNILIDSNKIDGSYESAWVPGTTDWFAIQNAVPALLGKTWPIILDAKVQTFNYVGGCGNCQPVIEIITTTSTPTSTLPMATTTIEIATTSIELITVPTTTIETTSTTEITPTSTEKNTSIKKIATKKANKTFQKNIDQKGQNDNSLINSNTTAEDKKNNFTTILSSSKNSIINFGHRLLKLLRNML